VIRVKRKGKVGHVAGVREGTVACRSCSNQATYFPLA